MHSIAHITIFLLLLSQKADSRFTIPQRVEGWVNLGTAVSVQPVPKTVYLSGFREKHGAGFNPKTTCITVRLVATGWLQDAVQQSKIHTISTWNDGNPLQMIDGKTSIVSAFKYQ